MTALADRYVFPQLQLPWFLIITALVFLSNASETADAKSIDPDGLLEIMTGSPTIIFASSIMC